MVKHLSTMQETWVRSLGWEDSLEKEMATHSSTIAWKIPWTEEPGRLQSMGSQRVGHNWVTSLSLFTLLSKQVTMLRVYSYFHNRYSKNAIHYILLMTHFLKMFWKHFLYIRTCVCISIYTIHRSVYVCVYLHYFSVTAIYKFLQT